jgi:hypothetical protein
MTRLRFAPIIAVLFTFGTDFIAILTTDPIVSVLALGFTAVTFAILAAADNAS